MTMSPTALDAAVGVEHHAQRGQRVATGPMVDVHAAPLRLDQAGVAQLSQMMTDCRFAHPQGASKAAAGTVNLSNPRAIFAGSPPRFTRSRVTYEAYVVSFQRAGLQVAWSRTGA